MEQVTIWAAGVGSLIFCIGLASAFRSRGHQSKKPRSSQVAGRAPIEVLSKTITEQASMAAGGVANGGENLASVSSSAR